MNKECKNCCYFEHESGNRGYCHHKKMRVTILSPCALDKSEISSDLPIKVPVDFFCKYWNPIPTFDGQLTEDIAEIVSDFGYWESFSENRNLIHENNVVDGILLNKSRITKAFDRFAERNKHRKETKSKKPTIITRASDGSIEPYG